MATPRDPPAQDRRGEWREVARSRPCGSSWLTARKAPIAAVGYRTPRSLALPPQVVAEQPCRLVAKALAVVLAHVQEPAAQRQGRPGLVGAEEPRAADHLRALGSDFEPQEVPVVAEATPHRERKRMAALLIEDVTLVKRDVITAHVRCRGGRTETLSVEIPLNAWQLKQTDPRVVAEMDRLLDDHTNGQVAAILRERGMSTGAGEPFTSRSVDWARRSAGLKNLHQRLRAKGMLTTDEMAQQLGISPSTVKARLRQGLLEWRQVNDKGAWLFEPPDDALIAQNAKNTRRRTDRRRPRSPVSTASTAGGAV